MCGISGALDRAGDDPRDMAWRMVHAMRHRGPDDQDVFVDGPLALGHDRLSIIDVAGGHQPMFNEDGSIAVVFNGEIYNFRELADRLTSAGHTFRTRCDTEVLVHLYEEHGDALVDHLRGMFAFAIWDRPRRRLLLARDRFGIKPLAWYDDGKRFLFASEIKGLLAAPALEAGVDTGALQLYFSLGWIPAPRSAWEGIHKLPPGHLLVVEGDAPPRLRRWWDLRDVQVDPHLDEQEALDRLDSLVRDAVRVRLVSDVPLGAFLSGGTDSSLVVAAMAAAMDRPVKTFTIGFQEAEYDETPYAGAVAAHLGTEHTQEILRPDVVSLLDKVVYHMDEPFADSSAIPTWCVSEMTRAHVTVALSGDGGDELFCGYGRYLRQQVIELASHAPPWALTGAEALLGRLPSRGPVHRARRMVSRAALPFPDRYASGLLFHPDPAQKARLLSPDMVSDEPALDVLRAQGLHTGGLRDCRRLDALLYLPDDILTKVDRMSMAVSLEARVPLLDHHLATFALSLPERLLIRGTETKHLLKRLLLRYLPPGLVYRKKMGFAVPLALWFRRELRDLVRDELLSPRCLDRGILRREGVRDLIDTHQSGERDLSAQLWSLLVFERWMQRRSRPD